MTDELNAFTIVLAYFERNGRILLTRRPSWVHSGDCWEFPGGKVEERETLPAALQREMREELGIGIAVEEELASVRHAYPDRVVDLHLFRCRITDSEPMARQVSALRWVPCNALQDYDMPSANAKLLAALSQRTGHQCP